MRGVITAGGVLCALIALSPVAEAARIDGLVHDAGTGAPVAGARLVLFFDDEDAQAAGDEVPAAELGAGQQGQITGVTGEYEFDVPQGRRYRIVVDVAGIARGFPSSQVPPQPGFAPIGDVVPGEVPSVRRGVDRRYFLRFDIPAAGDDVSNNHIPLDALTDVVRLDKRADRSSASTGDVVGYTLVLTNRSGRDLVASDGRAVSILDAPPRGFSYVAASAAASVRRGASGGEPFQGIDRIENQGSKRLVRFGPFDLPAGAELTIRYHAVIGVDTRPGRYVNTAVALDAGGVELSARAAARVDVVPDRDLETSLVLGRVFCDRNRDGRAGDGEPGVFGARVYIDTGSYAASDAAGLFHLSRIPPGTHLVKLDADTLAGSKLRGDPTRLLRLTDGLAEKVSFPVDCAGERVTTEHRRASIRHGTQLGEPVPEPTDGTSPTQVVVDGELTLLHVTVDGRALDLPAAVAALSAPAAIRLRAGAGGSDLGINLVDVPAGGYAADRPRWRLSWTAPGGITGRSWRFAIRPLDARGRPAAPVFTLSGKGQPPASLSWDGRTDAGAPASAGLYAAQLTVVGSDRNAEAASAHSVFGIAHGAAPKAARSLVWTGPLFGGTARAPTPTADLQKQIAALKASLGPDDKLDIEVHFDGTGERLSTIARTQREARKLVELLVAAGISADRVTARGRGSLEPLEPPRTAAARRKNRRIEVGVVPPPGAGSGNAVPTSIAGDADALIEGKPVPVDDRGRFRTTVAVPGRRALLIDVRALDGRRAAIDVPIGKSAARPRTDAGLSPRKVQVDGDLAARTLAVDFDAVSARLLEIDAVFSAGGAAVPDVALRRRLPAAPLEFQLTVPDTLAVASWRLAITDADGNPVAGTTGAGKVPPTWSWNGADGKRPVLSAGRRYLYQLAVELADGSAGWSPARAFTVDRKRARTAAALAAEPTAPAASVAVNGVAARLAGDRFSTQVNLPVGGAVIVDITTGTGHRARVHAVAGGERGQDELLDPDQDDVPVLDDTPATAGATREMRESRAARLQVVLPPEGTDLASDELPVHGVADPQTDVTINGAAVHVARDGRFASVVRVAPGASVVTIQSRDRAGFVATIRWPVSVRRRQMFGLALGEGIAATSYTSRGWFGDTAYLSGMTEDTTYPLGRSVLLGGRFAAYVKARLSEPGAFDRVDITAHVDTGRREGASALFENLVDPQRDFPVHGDSSTEVRDVNTRGKIYLRVQADESKAVVGAVVTDLRGGSLLTYDRTFDGAAIDVERQLGDHRPSLQAFGTPERTDHARDINLYRATGGSLYYLRHGRVLEGSEQVRVIVRDRNTGLVVSERELVRNRDYTVDHDGGRVLLIEPLASTAAADALIHNLDAAAMPLDGNPVYLQITYEHADPGGPGQRAGGVYARNTIADRVSIGGGAVIEERGADSDYTLWGADALIRAGARSTLRAEVAGSRERDAANVLSQDGGLTFGDLDAVSRTTGDFGRGLNLGWKLSADFHGADAAGTGVLAGTRLSLYAQDLDRGFSSGNAILEQGRLKYGGALQLELGADDRLTVRHDGERAELPRVGPTAADVAAADPVDLDERHTELTSVGWAGDRGRWHHRLEVAHQRLTSTAQRAPDPVTAEVVDAIDARRLGFGAGTRYDVTERLAVRAGQQLIVDAGDADPVLAPIDPMSTGNRDGDALAGVISNVGSDVLLAEGLRLSADYFQRWNGDNAAQLGLRSTLSETGSMYVAERFGASGGQLVSTTVIGADDRFGHARGGVTYGEYQIDHGVLGQRNRALLGLGHRWQVVSGIALGAGFEHQQAFGGFLPDGTPIGDNRRDVIAAAIDYTGHDRIKAAAQVEIRFEEGVAGAGAADDLVRDDPRPITDPGAFADHGGVAPGAPLILPPGERVQLVTGGGLDWQAARELTLFGRIRWARTIASDEVATGDPESHVAARYAEAAVGWAYRPVSHDWFDLIARYSFLLDRRPLAGLDGGSETQIHAVAVIPIAQLPYSLRLSGKFAFKSSELARLGVTDPADDEPELETGAEALLALIRLGYQFYGNWDITGEYRTLHVFKPVEDERRHGTLWELGYTIGRQVRIGAGYNLSRFSDNELSLERDSHGFFLRVTGQY